MILTTGEEEKLRRFERKIVRKIHDPKKAVEGVYQRLMNSDAQKRLRGEEDNVKAIKTQMVRWYCHTRRMGKEKVAKKVTGWKPDSRKARGRPKSRWEKHVLEDMKRLRIHNLRGKIQDRKSRKRITKEAKTSKALE